MSSIVAGASDEEVVVISTSGKAHVTPSGKNKPVACKEGMSLAAGARITTEKGAYVRIAFDDLQQNIVKINENSDVVLKLADGEKIELVDGQIYALLRNVKKGETFRVRTPCAVCGARGTGWGTKTDGKASEVAVFEDKVFVRGLNKDGSAMEKFSWVKKGYKVKIKKFEKPGKKEKLSAGEMSEMEKEAGLDKEKKKRRTRGIGSGNGKREEYRESILERKSEDKKESLLDRNDRRGSIGGRSRDIGP
jgi:ferric-dicitrate binding protein FerR (iron transport regulator)